MKRGLHFLIFLLLPGFASAQAISINTDGSNPAASAILDVKSTDKGVLVPRMTTAQRTAIVAPATGLLVFDTTMGGFWFYNGTAWTDLSTPRQLADADNDTKIQVEKTPDEDIIRMDLAGSERLVIRKNNPTGNSTILELPNSNGNIFIGPAAGASNTTGVDNTAVGAQALTANMTGLGNTAHGRFALFHNTTGFSNVAIGREALFSNTTGSNLVAVGDSALYNNGLDATESYHAIANTAIGSKALFANTIGRGNTANGFQALFSNTIGYDNTANGSLALNSNISGIFNTASGSLAMLLNTTGSRNTAAGEQALKFNTSGSQNTATGSLALYSNTTGSSNTAVGAAALHFNKANSRSTAIGFEVMYYADDRTTGQETFNTAVGYQALRGSNTPGDNVGQYNTAMGDQAMFSNTLGFENTAYGFNSLYLNTVGQMNTASGVKSLYSNTSGNANSANGALALYANSSGSFNTANGHQALGSNVSGTYNTANGKEALGLNLYGSYNTATGYQALSYNITGHYNTAIGNNADVASPDLVNATAIGDHAMVATSNSMILGSIAGVNNATKSVKVGIGDNAPSHTLTIKSSDTETMRLIGSLGNYGHGARLNFGDGDIVYLDEPEDDKMRIQAISIGIKRTPVTNALEVEGDASKSSAGDWLANSDARLKKNIIPLNSEETLGKLLALKGVIYEWNDDKTGSKRPEGIQYGFTAQNIQAVFPTLVEEDKLGYLQTAYGTYDAMTVEAIRALNDKITTLETENAGQKAENATLKAQLEAQTAQLQKITTALQTAGIGVGN